MGLPRPELAGWEETCTTGVGNWQAGRREEEFTASESEVEVLEPACLGGDTKGNKTENPKTKKIEKSHL